MNETEPVVTIFPDGQIVIGAGCTIGDVLQALEAARRAVLGLVPVPAGPTQPSENTNT